MSDDISISDLNQAYVNNYSLNVYIPRKLLIELEKP